MKNIIYIFLFFFTIKNTGADIDIEVSNVPNVICDFYEGQVGEFYDGAHVKYVVSKYTTIDAEQNKNLANSILKQNKIFPSSVKEFLIWSMLLGGSLGSVIGFLFPPVLLFGYFPYKIGLYLYNRYQGVANKRNKLNKESEKKDLSDNNQK
jgi:hypothetical protein